MVQRACGTGLTDVATVAVGMKHGLALRRYVTIAAWWDDQPNSTITSYMGLLVCSPRSRRQSDSDLDRYHALACV